MHISSLSGLFFQVHEHFKSFIEIGFGQFLQKSNFMVLQHKQSYFSLKTYFGFWNFFGHSFRIIDLHFDHFSTFHHNIVDPGLNIFLGLKIKNKINSNSLSNSNQGQKAEYIRYFVSEHFNLYFDGLTLVFST